MLSLEAIAGVDPADPRVRLALELANEDRRLLQRLRELRRMRGLSQRDVADRLGISQPAIAAFERHDADPKLSTIRRYAQVIGIGITHIAKPRWQNMPIAVGLGAAAPVTPVAASAYSEGRATLRVAHTYVDAA